MQDIKLLYKPGKRAGGTAAAARAGVIWDSIGEEGFENIEIRSPSSGEVREVQSVKGVLDDDDDDDVCVVLFCDAWTPDLCAMRCR